VCLVLLAGCARTLPDQDRRILTAVPVVKTTSEFFWREYQDNVAEANRKYWGQPVELAGRVASVSKDAPAFVMFEQKEAAGGTGVKANLLDDQANDILVSAVIGQRLRLKCYCAGMSDTLVLKSCVKP
jgi:hypothetical protein